MNKNSYHSPTKATQNVGRNHYPNQLKDFMLRVLPRLDKRQD